MQGNKRKKEIIEFIKKARREAQRSLGLVILLLLIVILAFLMWYIPEIGIRIDNTLSNYSFFSDIKDGLYFLATFLMFASAFLSAVVIRKDCKSKARRVVGGILLVFSGLFMVGTVGGLHYNTHFENTFLYVLASSIIGSIAIFLNVSDRIKKEG